MIELSSYSRLAGCQIARQGSEKEFCGVCGVRSGHLLSGFEIVGSAFALNRLNFAVPGLRLVCSEKLVCQFDVLGLVRKWGRERNIGFCLRDEFWTRAFHEACRRAASLIINSHRLLFDTEQSVVVMRRRRKGTQWKGRESCLGELRRVDAAPKPSFQAWEQHRYACL